MTDFSYDASRHLKKGRGKVYDSIVDTIGDTPIVRLPRLSAEYDTKATVLAKLEFFNPIASVKDRIGVAMVEALQEAGKIDQDTVLIEPTSGNTGIALAWVGAALGYKVIIAGAGGGNFQVEVLFHIRIAGINRYLGKEICFG